MMIETKEDLQSLNKRRKALMVEVAQLKRHQENNLYRISQDVGTYLEDHAEKYFSLEGDFKDKTFAQRFDASLKAMRSELRSLEQFIGIGLHDMDEEIDRAVAKLSIKEKEFDNLEEHLRAPMTGTKDYQDLLNKFLSASLSIDAEKEYQRLHRSIARKEKYEEDLTAIVTKREKQLEQELSHLHKIFHEHGQQKRSLLETVYQHAIKDFDARRAAYRQNIDKEYDRMLSQANQDREELHQEFMRRYELSIVAFQPTQLPNGTDGAIANLAPTSNWKTEVMDQHETALQYAQSQRDGQLQRDQLLVQQLRQTQKIVLDPSPLEDLCSKLAALYQRYDDSILDPERRKY